MTLDGGAERVLTNRPGGRASSDLFICFTSRPSSSASMRTLSNKSLPSPGRKEGKFRDPLTAAAGAPAPALSVSLSRRLRSSGSVKGGQSPGLFATGGGRKKASSFEAAEPTSPKVTCIGQVRVKTGRRKKKKAAAALRSRSRREVSFRRPDQRGDGLAEKECFPNRGQSWVHLPLGNICEAVKAFGSEINCFTPCGGGGSGRAAGSGEAARENVGDGRKRAKMGTCGSAFARWLMAIDEEEEEEEEEGKRGDEKVEMGILEEEVIGRRGSRRELREFEMVADELLKGGMAAVEKSVEVEVSAVAEEVPVCVPPRNALLLMRCRSDPVKMSALATRFWGSPVAAKISVEEVTGCGNGRKEDVEDEEPSEIKGREANSADVVEKAGSAPVAATTEENPSETGITEEGMEKKDGLLQKELGAEQNMSGGLAVEAPKTPILEEEQREEALDESPTLMEGVEENQAADECHSHDDEVEKENRVVHSSDTIQIQEDQKYGEKKKSRRPSPVAKDIEEKRSSFSKEREAGRRHSFSMGKDVRRSSSCREGRRSSFSSEGQPRRSSFSTERETRRRRQSFSTEKEARRAAGGTESAMPIKALEEKLAELLTRETEKATVVAPAAADSQLTASAEVRRTRKEEEKKEGLPDCLLLMMYEPKLSMEVSKETWVCTADFIRWKPHQRRLKNKQANTTTGDRNGDGGQEAKAADAEVEPVKPDASGAAGPPQLPAPPVSVPVVGEVLSPPDSALVADAEVPSTTPEAEKTVEQKLGSATAAVSVAAYGPPFVLTRCKSEPMRSSAKQSPEMCFWKSRHQPIGAAGLGF